jgi:capsular exopolysaccharide synthesis family protein
MNKDVIGPATQSLLLDNSKVDSRPDTNNPNPVDRVAVASTGLGRKSGDGTRLSALAESITQNPDLEDAYVSLLGALRLKRPLANGAGNSILVTSTAPGEGKTTVTACLGLTASLGGQIPLLIDGDLRRFSLATSSGVANTVGLTEILLDQAEPAETIHTLAPFTNSRRASVLRVMAGGKQAPIALLSVDWTKARTTFRSLAQTFDIVLVDSPPVLAANDALLLAGIVDAVLLVVGARNANLDEMRQAKEQLEQTGTPVIGAVLNRFVPEIHGRSNKPYRGYYRL